MKTSTALVKLIVFIVVTSMMSLLLAATIGNISFTRKAGYKAEFTDVTGLLTGNDVRIAGVRVGKVTEIELTRKGTALVSFVLENRRRIPESSIARLRYRNLVGERYLALTEGKGSARPLEEDATLPLEQTRNALDLTVLFNGFRPLFQALDPKAVNDVAFEVIKTLQGEGGTVESLIARTASLTNTLADRDEAIGRTIDNLTKVLTTVDDSSGDLETLITELRGLASGFAQDRQAIGVSLAGINALTGSTAGLLEDIRQPLAKDIRELGDLATTLDKERETVRGTFERLPNKLNKIDNTATHAGWFNFYLCGFQAFTIEDGRRVQVVPELVNKQAARCFEQ